MANDARGELVAAVLAALEERDRRKYLDDATHRTHHDFVEQLIEERRMRRQRWEKVKVYVYGSTIVSAILGLVWIVGEGAKRILESIGGRPPHP